MVCTHCRCHISSAETVHRAGPNESPPCSSGHAQLESKGWVPHRADFAAQHLVELVVRQEPAAVDVEGVEGLLDPLVPFRRLLYIYIKVAGCFRGLGLRLGLNWSQGQLPAAAPRQLMQTTTSGTAAVDRANKLHGYLPWECGQPSAHCVTTVYCGTTRAPTEPN